MDTLFQKVKMEVFDGVFLQMWHTGLAAWCKGYELI